MKIVIPLLLSSLTLIFASSLMAAETEIKGCAAKQRQIQQQLDQAKAHKNAAQVAGLQTALDASLASCTDASLQQEREKKVQSARHKVSEREQELSEAQTTGKSSKIVKRQAKLSEAQKELQQAQEELAR
ncbi:DUF1090 domain-containing protein [Pseudomonas protegens]|jgi:DNA-binding NarL/FixJ family response regulator|uniref:DUF1090 domain-containing protein n=1 Tax=Pseudomonas protegens TaxID=380021 RepID=UPI003EB8F626